MQYKQTFLHISTEMEVRNDMPDIIKSISLDLSNQAQFSTITVNQGDAISRKLDIQITNNGEIFTVPSDAICSIRMVRSDGYKIDDKCDVIDSKIRVVLMPYMTALAEKIPAQIKILLPSSGGNIKTLRFYLLVNHGVVTDEFLASTGSFTLLDNALLQVNDWENRFSDRLQELDFSLTQDYLRNTTQIVTFNVDGTVQKVQHKDINNVVIREDVYTYSGDIITEVRTMNTGESITITYNLSTYQQTIS
jgi:hypothetical protein